jgi:hypothetical protein
MIGVMNRVSHVICELAPCTWRATHTEYVTVIPGNPALKHERHAIDVVLCWKHDDEFHANGLDGVTTAHGDTIIGNPR